MNNPEFLADLRAFAAAMQVKHNWPSLNYTANQILFTANDIVPSQRPKYTQEQLREAFKAVQPTDNWKNPIRARVFLDDEGVELTHEAIVHFTGGRASIVPVPGAKKVNGKTRYEVSAAGYYVCVGA